MDLSDDDPEVVLVMLDFVHKGKRTVIHDELQQDASDAPWHDQGQPSLKRKKMDLSKSGKLAFALNKPSSRKPEVSTSLASTPSPINER